MDTCAPPPADSVVAAEAFYGWIERQWLREEIARLRALHSAPADEPHHD